MSEPPAPRPRAPIAGAGWMTLAQLAFSGMAVGARVGGSGVPWQEVCASRFVVGALTAFVVARLRGPRAMARLRRSLGPTAAR